MRQPELSVLERELVIAAVAAAKLARALTIASAVLRKDRGFPTVRFMESVSSGERDQTGGAQQPLPFPRTEDPFA